MGNSIVCVFCGLPARQLTLTIDSRKYTGNDTYRQLAENSVRHIANLVRLSFSWLDCTPCSRVPCSAWYVDSSSAWACCSGHRPYFWELCRGIHRTYKWPLNVACLCLILHHRLGEADLTVTSNISSNMPALPTPRTTYSPIPGLQP